MTIGSHADNQKAGTADRPELLQEADSAEASEAVAKYSCACGRVGVDCVAFHVARFAGVFERETEQSPRSVRNAVRSVPRSRNGRILRKGEKFGVPCMS